MSNFITKCDCGTVITQVPCFAKENIENVVAKGCEKCKTASQSEYDVERADKLKSLQNALADYFQHDNNDSRIEAMLRESQGKPEQLAKAIEDVQSGEETDQTAVALKKLHKGEQDQLAVEIKKKHVNK